jgi:predicted RNase H-like HicB family nuclease
MELQFTAVFQRVPEGYFAFVEELPGANSQGATLEEARQNLREAVGLVLDTNRALATESTAGVEVDAQGYSSPHVDATLPRDPAG